MTRIRVGMLAAAVAGMIAALAFGPAGRLWAAERVLADLSAKQPDDALLREQDLVLPGRSGPVRARLYRRADVAQAPGIVVAHGVHYLGIDEPRLVRFARALARAGRVVLTPELADLADYRITSASIDAIEDSVEYLGTRPEVASRRVGLVGFSFAGGESLLAASRPELAERLAFVTSVGGYDDLSRVLRFLATDAIDTPEGVVHEKAHEYGLVVLLYEDVEALVPPEDVTPLRDALRAWLHEDFDRARALAVRRRTLAGERLFDMVEEHKLGALAPRLLALLDQHRAELDALSPRGRLRAIAAPVYLLHGAGDTVIPPSEARWADHELGGRDHALLVTPLLEHVSVSDKPGLADELRLLGFMSRMM